MNAPTIVFVPAGGVPSKIEAIRRLGAEVRMTPGGYGDAERIGLEYAREQAMTWVSPYNDGQVIAGAATVGLEALRQLSDPDLNAGDDLTWIVPVGGGGLCAGIAGALDGTGMTKGGKHRLIGVQSIASPFFQAIFHEGTQTGQIELPSLADGLAGPVEANSVTIPILRLRLDDFVLVSEEEIREAIIYAWQHYQAKIEGSAAASLAAVLTEKVSYRSALVVISGGNIQPELHAQLCSDPSAHTKLEDSR